MKPCVCSVSGIQQESEYIHTDFINKCEEEEQQEKCSHYICIYIIYVCNIE